MDDRHNLKKKKKRAARMERDICRVRKRLHLFEKYVLVMVIEEVELSAYVPPRLFFWSQWEDVDPEKMPGLRMALRLLGWVGCVGRDAAFDFCQTCLACR